MKKAAIVCDDYKVATFKKQVTEAGFTISSQKDFTKGSTLLEVEFPEERRHELVLLIKKIEQSFHLKKRQN